MTLRDAVDLRTVSRALVIKLRHHGDVLLTSPVFTVLKNRAPHIEIDALVYRDTAEMLTLHPAISEVFGIDRKWKQGRLSQISQEWRLVRALRARRYDLVIHLTEHARGARLARWLRPRCRVAMEFPKKRGPLWRHSFTHLYKIPDRPRHTVEKHLDALRRIGVYPGADERKLVLRPGPDAEQSVRAMLTQEGLTPKGFVHLHPTSRWLFKCWQIDKYSELIDLLHARGERVVVTGGPDARERAMIRQILVRLKRPAVDWSGRLSMKQLAALTAQAKCFIGVDSAPMHIAAAMQTPVVALFGPSGDLEWGPWQVPHRVVTASYSCRPCGIDGCGGGKISECLTAIPVHEVVAAVQPFLTLGQVVLGV